MSAKMKILLLSGLIAIIAIGIGVFLLLSRQEASDTDTIDSGAQATLVIVEQSITVMREGQQLPISGDEVIVYAGDTIKTDPHGAGYIVFADNSVMALDHSTEIALQAHELSDTTATISIKQIVGKTRSNVKKVTGKQTEYSVETSNTLASVRGTKFGCETKNGTTTCYSEDGNVELTLKNIVNPNIDNILTITGGQEFENSNGTITMIQSTEALLALITEYVPEDSSWTDFVQCIDVGVNEYGISCEDITGQLPQTGDETSIVTSTSTEQTSSIPTGQGTTTTTTTAKITTTTTSQTTTINTTSTTSIIPEPEITWTATAGSNETDEGLDVATDMYGNVYITGYFRGDGTDLDGTSGTDLHFSNGGDDVFLTKYFSDGRYAWTRTWGGSGEDRGWGITVSDAGEIYVVGYFKSAAVEFNTSGSGQSDIRTGHGVSDVFLTKYFEDGNYGWTRISGDTEDPTYGKKVTLDSDGNPVIVGNFMGVSQDFDDTSDIDLHSSSGYWDVFITRYNANGTYGKTITNGTSTDYEYGGDIAGDMDGNIFAAGSFFTSNSGIYVLKYNANLSLQWSQIINNTGNDGANGIAVDNFGDVYITGHFENTVDFNPSAGTDSKISNGGTDIFITKMLSDSTYDWTRVIGGQNDDVGNGIDVMEDAIAVTGNFEGTDVNFNDSGGADLQTSYGGQNPFITMYQPNGNYFDTVTFGATGSHFCNRIAVDFYGTVAVTGAFQGTSIEFDGISGGDIHSSQGAYDIFLTRYLEYIPLP